MYARAGIPEAWLVHLAALEVIVHRDPHDGAYASVRIVGLGEELGAQAFPDVTITVDELLTG